MTPKDSEERFVRNARQSLEAESSRLDDATCRQLQRIRKKALDTRAGFHPRLFLSGGMGWLAGTAAAAVLVAAIYFGSGTTPMDRAAQTPAEDLEIVTLDEPLDLIDDIEFYAWLAETDDGDV